MGSMANGVSVPSSPSAGLAPAPAPGEADGDEVLHAQGRARGGAPGAAVRLGAPHGRRFWRVGRRHPPVGFQPRRPLPVGGDGRHGRQALGGRLCRRVRPDRVPETPARETRPQEWCVPRTSSSPARDPSPPPAPPASAEYPLSFPDRSDSPHAPAVVCRSPRGRPPLPPRSSPLPSSPSGHSRELAPALPVRNLPRSHAAAESTTPAS